MLLNPTESYVCPEVQRARRLKFVRFIIWQVAALSVVAGSVALGISQHFTDESLTLVFKLLTISAAVAAAIIPIIFYALPPIIPRS